MPVSQVSHPASRGEVRDQVSPLGAPEAITDLAGVLKALGDPARLQILDMLAVEDEVCACDVSGRIAKTPATTSHHLKVLREAGLIASERRGTWVYYRLVGDRVAQTQRSLASLVP